MPLLNRLIVWAAELLLGVRAVLRSRCVWIGRRVHFSFYNFPASDAACRGCRRFLYSLVLANKRRFTRSSPGLSQMLHWRPQRYFLRDIDKTFRQDLRLYSFC
jgi:hypothetical protein